MDESKNSHGVYWYDQKVGTFRVENGAVAWNGYTNPVYENLFEKRPSDGLPTHVANMNPEGWLDHILRKPNQVNYLTNGRRFLSNLTIFADDAVNDGSVQVDRLHGHLSEHTLDGTFVGRYALPKRSVLRDNFNQLSGECWENAYMPRFCGHEPKLPVMLTEDGSLVKSKGEPFTHILKFSGLDHRETIGVNEWTCLNISKAIGLETPDCALLPMGDLPPALLIERFDIPQKSGDDGKMKLVQDFCALAGFDNDDAHKGSHEKIAKTLLEQSLSPHEDAVLFFKRSLLEWAVKDTDMHRKNVAIMTSYDPKTGDVDKRLAPVYDVTSDVFSDPRKQSLDLSLQGKKNNLRRKDFVNFAIGMGIEKDEADRLIDDTMKDIVDKAQEIAANPPAEAKKFVSCVYTVQKIAEMTTKTAQSLGVSVPDYPAVEFPDSMKKPKQHVRMDSPVTVAAFSFA